MQQRHPSHARNRQPKDAVPMTPMIDVVFQLLVYFIFTFQPMDVMAELAVTQPGGGPPGESSPFVRISITESGYYVNQRAFDQEELDRLLAQIAELDPDQVMMLVCHDAVSHQKIVAVMDLCIRHGLERLSMISVESPPRSSP